MLQRYSVEFKGVSENNQFRTILSWVIPSVIFVVIWMYVGRRMGEHAGMPGLMAIGEEQGQGLCGKRHQGDFRRRR